MKKKEIQKLYRLEPEMSARGKVKEVPVYIGGYYKLGDGETSYKKVALRLMALLLATLMCFVLVALPDPQGLRQLYIALPYVTLFLPYVFSIVGSLTIYNVKGDMNEVQYADGMNRIVRNSIAARVILVMVAISEIAFVAFNASKCNMEDEVFLFMGAAVMFFLNEVRLRYVNKIIDGMRFEKQQVTS